MSLKALHNHILRKNQKKVSSQLQKGVNVNGAAPKTGLTALHIASSIGEVDMIRLLLTAGATKSLEARETLYGATPILISCQEGRTASVILLYESGAAITAVRSADDASALYLAAQEGHTEVLDMLLDTGKLDVNFARSNGSTALYVASRKGKYEVVLRLLQQDNIDINAKCRDSTPLEAAIWGGHMDVVQLLVSHGGLVTPKRPNTARSRKGLKESKVNHRLQKSLQTLESTIQTTSSDDDTPLLKGNGKSLKSSFHTTTKKSKLEKMSKKELVANAQHSGKAAKKAIKTLRKMETELNAQRKHQLSLQKEMTSWQLAYSILQEQNQRTNSKE